MAGLIQDNNYFEREVLPHIDGEQVQYVGNVGPEDRDRLMRDAAVMLHPISFEEPFGLSVAESMMTGTPVIANNMGSMPELIQDGKNGFLSKNVDEAAEMVAHATNLDRERIAREARARFGVNQMVDGYLGVYRDLLD